MDKIIKKFEQWCRDNQITPTELTNEYKNICKKKQIDEDNKRFESHKELIGKCYKHGGRFYKIISIKANNSSRISCLVFSENPKIEFSNRITFSSWFSDYEGSFEFNETGIADVLVGTKYGTIDGITDWEEITESEYRNAYYKSCAALLNYKWEEL